MNKKHLNYFSGSETRSVHRFSRFRDTLFSPVVRILAALKITPGMVTFVSLLSMAGFVYYIPSDTYMALLFVVVHIALDGIDGPLARFKKVSSNSGAFADICTDQLGLVIAVLALIYFSMIDPFWAAYYLVGYIIMITFLVTLNHKNNGIGFVFRSKYFFYAILFIDAYFQVEFMRPFLMIFSVYMTILSLYLFNKIRCSL